MDYLTVRSHDHTQRITDTCIIADNVRDGHGHGNLGGHGKCDERAIEGLWVLTSMSNGCDRDDSRE
jgi:hypothetical protein